MTLAHRFRDFAIREARDNSPLYHRRALEIADDPAVLALIAQLPTDKQQPNLVLAAARIHGVDAPSYGEFREQLCRNWAAISATALARRTQTNEVGRMAALLPALAELPGPLSLIEVGASAGLCLYPDRFSYRYGEVALDPPDGESPVLLACQMTGPVPIPAAMPRVVHRAGVDLHPLDATDRGDRDWLTALIWPGQDHRVARLRAACDIAATDPPRLVTGDLTQRVTELVSAAPTDSTVVIFHSAVLAYLPISARHEFRAMVRGLPCRWISQEGAGVLPWLIGALPEVDSGSARMVVAMDEVPLAYAGPHGQTLDWFG
ncbi:DUF2332 domain-containing protein [Nocardia halotolerans]|uniref:DUF2332 domain-containing protein n=1 Tax=Nocardia halotolerans TaxID=1755878 RepID=A0ABV8V9A8_9NOCA